MSLPSDDVQFLDAYASAEGFPSRSAVIQRAVRLLRLSLLSSAYQEAWEEWESTGEAGIWNAATGDGLHT